MGRSTVFDTRCVHVALDGSLDAQMPFGHNVERRDEEASHIVGNASANRLGLREVILPRANEPDLDDLPASVRGAITFHPWVTWRTFSPPHWNASSSRARATVKAEDAAHFRAL